jgi:hypothetical protein
VRNESPTVFAVGLPIYSVAMSCPEDIHQKSASLLRAILVGLLLVPFNCYWVICAELRWYVILTLNPLFVTPVFYLFVLTGVNAALKRFAPRMVFKPAELVVIYVMLVMSCTVATHDFIINLISSMAWPAWFATPENRWEQTVFPHLPKWLLVWDKNLLRGYFSGSASIWDPQVLAMWAAPLAFWTVFILTIGWTMLCMNVLIRKAWVDETRLSFPIVRLPLEMTEESLAKKFFTSEVMWLGFAIAAAINIMNGLHEYFPNMPHLQTRATWIVFRVPPWTAIRGFCATFYPFAIGLAYLVPLDVSFSCWFFYLFAKAQAVIGYQLGYGNVPDFPFVTEQSIGAWLAFGVSLIYISRRHLARAVRLALSSPDGSDSEEPMSYRVAFWGFVAGSLVFFAFWRAAGMSVFWALTTTALYLLLSLCITRVRAEAGGQHTVWDLEPKNLMRLFDSRFVGHANLAAAAISHWYWRLNRSHVMPSQLEALKLAEEHNIDLKRMVLPILAAFALATVCGMWSCLHILYRDGAAKCQGFAWWTGIESYNWLGDSINQGFRAEATRWSAVGAGSCFVIVLAWLRSRFVWFPFHPLGYCIGPALIWLWLPFLIAWAVKLVILRYGGLRLYRRSLPFFLGLVLGDYVTSAIWSLIGVTWGIPVYQIFH